MKSKWLIYFFSLVVFANCSTGKNTWLSRSYHNLTARYNVLFNGIQSFEEGREQMRESLADDFSEILPMFAYCVQADGQVPTAQMKRAIRKGLKLIDKHSITVKPQRKPSSNNPEYQDFYNQREFNRWVDDAWILIGKAHIYSQNWYEAVSAFDMVLQIFPDHKTHLEAMLWMARAYIEMEDFDRALQLLQQYRAEAGERNPYLVLEQSTLAWLRMRQKNYNEALKYCQNAASNTNDKWEKIRWYFILGQLAQKVGDYDTAYDAFNKVCRLKPDYETTIHARIQQALLAGLPDQPDIARNILKKYAKEYKNQNYRGQIYRGIAETWFNEGDTIMALANLQLAAGYAHDNPVISGKIFKQMADISFQNGNYILADAYYDSALVILPEDYHSIPEIEHIKNKLAPLAENLRIIEHQDSVLRIAAMPEDERNRFIEQLIQQKQELEDANDFVDNVDDAFFYRNFAYGNNSANDESDSWYFYNPPLVSLGQMEFEKRWGRRNLEDDWRRSDKKSQVLQSEANNQSQPDDPFAQNLPPDQSNKPVNEKNSNGEISQETLLAGLPLTSEEKAEAHRKIEEALISAANILANNFSKYSEAVALFEELLVRYPQSTYTEEAITGIYLACREMHNSSCLDYYGNMIVRNYPNSTIAQFISNPDYYENLEALSTKMEETYAKAYQKLQQNDWKGVVEVTSSIIHQRYEPLLPQSFLINALAYSQLNQEPMFLEQLQHIVDNFPQSPQAEVADYWLQQFNNGQKPGKIDFSAFFEPSGKPLAKNGSSLVDTIEDDFAFVMAPDAVHQLIIVLSRQANVNELMFQLANFNFDHFTTRTLQLKKFEVAPDRTVLMSGPLENQLGALDYFFSLINQPSVFKVEQIDEPLVMIINDVNWQKINNASDLENYTAFFLEKYLPESSFSTIVINESEIPDYSYTERANKD